MGGACSKHGRDEKYDILAQKPEGKRPLGRPRHRWEHSMGMGFRELGWVGVDWMHLAQYTDQWQAVVNMVMNL
jgi:hypothetical protein